MKKRTDDYESLFSECYKRYSRSVTKFIYSRIGDWDTAEELSQDLFSYLFESKRILDISQPSTKSFLFTAARNRTIDHLRRKLRMIPSSENIEEIVPDESLFASVADGCCDGEVTGTLYESIIALPEIHRRALIMHVYQGKGVRQISRRLHTSEYMVNAALRSARTSIKESLAKYFPSK